MMTSQSPASPPGRAAQAVALVISLAAVFAVSIIGGLATASSVSGWYQTLEKPPFNPPDWLFGPVWTVLYVMMAVAAWRVWRRRSPHGRRALTLYGLQLLANLSWPLLMFGLQRVDLALISVAAMLVAVTATILAFWPIDRIAAALLAPYLAWTAFAAVLNFAIWRLN